MQRFSLKKILVPVFILFVATFTANAQLFHRNPEKRLFGKSSGIKKEAKVREPGKVTKAKRKQEAKQKKIKGDSKKASEKSRKRTYDIQTDDVKARMKKNQKETEVRDKEKKKRIKKGTKSAGRKYKLY